MNRSLNRVMLIGWVEGSLESRRSTSGRSVASFTLSTAHARVTAAGERHEDNEWFNVVAWGTVAEACRERVGHGKHVYVEGRLHTRGWEDGDGRMHYRTEVVAQDVMVLGV